MYAIHKKERKGRWQWRLLCLFIRLIKARSSISPLYLYLHKPESTHSAIWQYHFQHSLRFSVCFPPLISPYHPLQKYCKCAWWDGLLLWQPEIHLLFKGMRKWMRKFGTECSWGNKRKWGEGAKKKIERTEHAQASSWLWVLEDVYRAVLFWKGQAAGSQWSSVRCFCWWQLISRTP